MEYYDRIIFLEDPDFYIRSEEDLNKIYKSIAYELEQDPSAWPIYILNPVEE
jgi:hypothetical protein